MFMNTRGICVYSYNGIASGSVAEWNRERQRSGMESRAAA